MTNTEIRELKMIQERMNYQSKIDFIRWLLTICTFVILGFYFSGKSKEERLSIEDKITINAMKLDSNKSRIENNKYKILAIDSLLKAKKK